MSVYQAVVLIGMFIAIVASICSYKIIAPNIIIRLYLHPWLLWLFGASIFVAGFWFMLVVQMLNG